MISGLGVTEHGRFLISHRMQLANGDVFGLGQSRGSGTQYRGIPRRVRKEIHHTVSQPMHEGVYK